MTDHVHEWEAGENKRGPIAICKCGKWLSGGEILAMLNAAEQLSAKQAIWAASIAPEGVDVSCLRTALHAYAKARGGE